MFTFFRKNYLWFVSTHTNWPSWLVKMYRVFKMDWRYFKELLWLCFWCQVFLPIIFMVEKCIANIHFDIWNKKLFTFSRGSHMILLIFQIWIWLKRWKMSQIEPNFFQKFLFQISKCTHFSTITMMSENVSHQKQSHSSSLRCPQSILNTL